MMTSQPDRCKELFGRNLSQVSMFFPPTAAVPVSHGFLRAANPWRKEVFEAVILHPSNSLYPKEVANVVDLFVE